MFRFASFGAALRHFRQRPTQKLPASNFRPLSWKWRKEARNGCVAVFLKSVELKETLSCRGWCGVGSWVSESRKLRTSRRGDSTRRLGSRHHGEVAASGARDLGRRRWRGLGSLRRWAWRWGVIGGSKVLLREWGWTPWGALLLSRVRLFWDPVDCSSPGFPVLHQLLKLGQIPSPWVGDAIQPSRPLSPSSPPAFNLS